MIRIGSRGSQLALWQAGHIAEELHLLGCETSIEIIRTAGDRMQEAWPAVASGKGIFTREIEEALLAGRIDLAVHSLKDLPTALDERFTLAAIPRRADPRDALVSYRYASLEQLPPGATVGTGSLRRQAQLRALRPDLRCIEFRGNVDTRLKKMEQGQADALIAAAAGLDRLRRTEAIRQLFSPEAMCPAPGQGALALECRVGDSEALGAVRPLDDADTRLAVTAERLCLAALGGGCREPIGAYCYRDGDEFSMTAAAADAGGAMVRASARDADASRLADRVARQLILAGAVPGGGVPGGGVPGGGVTG